MVGIIKKTVFSFGLDLPLERRIIRSARRAMDIRWVTMIVVRPAISSFNDPGSLFGLRIHAGGGVVQDQDLGAGKAPGQSPPAVSARRTAPPPLPDDGVVMLRQADDEIMDPGFLQR